VAEPEEDGRVGIGERVTLRHVSTGAMTSYRIVGVGEADPAAGEISYRSPIGSAVLGRGAGDVVEADAPSGRLRLEIVAVEE
jgi:transcription elongation factor GreA